jgi:3-dehydroquinate synthase
MQHLFNCTLAERKTEVFSLEDPAEVACQYPQALWVCDTHTQPFLPQHVLSVVLESGEVAKTWASVELIMQKARETSLARDGRLIAFGGGVVCDLTAFAASIYMRGCAVTLIPTTLLAMVDASLGGKTAIDLLGAKNLVGTFYPAENLMICTALLKSLSADEFANGLGEVLKHALLAADTALYQFLTEHQQAVEQRETTALDTMIRLSLAVKQSYIERDPTERIGIRDALNLGHTFAHALEAVGNMVQFSHGQSVAWGVIRALEAGVALSVTPQTFAHTYQSLFDQYRFATEGKVADIERFMQALESDKKRKNNQVRFILMRGQGDHVSMPLPKSLIQQLIS